MPNPEAIASYVARCQAVVKGDLTPLRNNPIDATITVYRNGSREVGCPLLKNGECRAALLVDNSEPTRCVQLSPEGQKFDLQSLSQPRRLEPIELDDTTTFGQAVSKYAHRVGMNQITLALFSEISLPYVNKIIKGKRKPPKVETTTRVISALGLSPEEAKDLYIRGGYQLDDKGNPLKS